MPDLAAGAIIRARDTPPIVRASNTTDITGISGTSYAAGTPEVGAPFLAPATGRVTVTVYGRIGNNGTNITYLSYEIREGGTSSGTQFRAASDDQAVTTKFQDPDEGQAITDRVTGLTPGATYYVRTMHRVSASNGGGVRMRRLIVSPAT